MTALALPTYAQLSADNEAALTELYRRGRPANTLRAWKRDLAYVAAWKQAAFGQPFVWPEDERVALRFVLDPAQDLTGRHGTTREVAMKPIALGLRRDPAWLAQATLDGAPRAAAMQLSLQRPAVQAQNYYADLEIGESPATDLLGY